MTDERPIEEALTLLLERPGLAENVQRIILDLVDAVQAGEKAHAPHTPTDDEREAEYLCDTCGEYMPCSCATESKVGSEREAIWDAFDDMHRITEGGCDTRGKDVADMVLGLGFRRSEPEPSAEVTHRGTFGHVWPCPLFYVGNWKRGDEEYYPAAECSNAAVCKRSEPQGEPSDAQVSNVSINGVRQTWQQLYELEHDAHVALQGYRTMLSDLDRNASGRHQGDYDSYGTGNGGVSAGNPHLVTGQIIGYDIGGREYVVPEPRERGTLSAWVRRSGGEGR